METAADRKRRLRRERILQNSESRMKRILGDPRDDTVRPTSDGNDDDVADSLVRGEGTSSNVEPQSPDAPSSNCAKNATEPLNGFYPHAREIGDETNDALSGRVDPSSEPTDDDLSRGSFGFDAAKFIGRERAAADVDDVDAAVSEWREAERLRKSAETKNRSQTSGLDANVKAGHVSRGETTTQIPNKRPNQADLLRRELETIMQQDGLGQPRSQSRSVPAPRRKPPSLWYTKTWFRISLTILLALFVRVLMQINLSDHFSDSAFYPFFSMELSFFVAAFCSKPPGYRIPMGGRIAEFLASLAGSSRELLGNLKWTYEFAFQKPLDEFFLYFFVFVLAHLVLIHVQDEGLHVHDEL